MNAPLLLPSPALQKLQRAPAKESRPPQSTDSPSSLIFISIDSAIQIIMHKITRRVFRQLSLLNNSVEKEALAVKCIERNAIAGAIAVTALVETTFEIAAGLILDGLGVVAGHDVPAVHGAEGEAKHVGWGIH